MKNKTFELELERILSGFHPELHKTKEIKFPVRDGKCKGYRIINNGLVMDLKFLEKYQDIMNDGLLVFTSVEIVDVLDLVRKHVEELAESKLEALWELNGLGNRGRL
jgi:hypothetical protein